MPCTLVAHRASEPAPHPQRSGDHGDAIIFIGKGNLFSTPIIVAASGAVTKQNNDEN
jgi:hypothetical protein